MEEARDLHAYTTYVWQVAWTGDETGSVTRDMSSTQKVTVGELQSVATKP
uniref:Uncharacterized protein n=1 Tax=Janibacter limosus TaxID=53458 RepID=A0AC61U330_9MICO|nr:hypothetical protein [Janibacter limosus]